MRPLLEAPVLVHDPAPPAALELIPFALARRGTIAGWNTS